MRWSGSIAWSIGSLALLATALPGCLAGTDDGVFGPDGEGSVAGPAGSPLQVLFKAKPARGPAPLVVDFSLDLRGTEDPGMAWSIDFGNGSREASGDRLPASASYNFTQVGSHEVTATVRAGDEATRSRLVLVVLPADAPPADPDEEVEGETMPVEEDDGAQENGTVGGGDDGRETFTTSSSSSGTTSGPSSSTGPSTSPPSSSSTTAPPPSPSSASTSSTSTTSTSSTPTSTAPPPSGNHPPQATLVASRTSGAAPLDVSFTIDASDPEGQPIQWTLDARDDGSIEASGDRGDVPRTITYRFDQPGTYVTALRVTDGVSTTTRTVTVTAT